MKRRRLKDGGEFEGVKFFRSEVPTPPCIPVLLAVVKTPPSNIPMKTNVGSMAEIVEIKSDQLCKGLLPTASARRIGEKSRVSVVRDGQHGDKVRLLKAKTARFRAFYVRWPWTPTLAGTPYLFGPLLFLVGLLPMYTPASGVRGCWRSAWCRRDSKRTYHRGGSADCGWSGMKLRVGLKTSMGVIGE